MARKFLGQLPRIWIPPLAVLLKGPGFWALFPKLLFMLMVPSRLFLPWISNFHHYLPLILSWISHAYRFLAPVPGLCLLFCLGACLALALLFSLVAQFTFFLLLPLTYLNPLMNTSISPVTYRIPSFLLVSLSRWPVRGMSISSSSSLRAAISLIMVLNTEWYELLKS